jgi:hypothetical protein
MARKTKTAEEEILDVVGDMESDGLHFDDRNANRGNRRGRAMVMESLEQFGAGRSIVSDKHGRVIAGNKTLEGARRINMPTRIIETDGSELIVVKRTDLDLKKDEKAKALGIADNRTSEIGLQWDGDILNALSSEVDVTQFFTEDELEKIIGTVVQEDSDVYPEMEIQPFEHYDYIMLTFKNSMDFLSACDKFAIKKVSFKFEGKKAKGYKVGIGRCIDGAKVLERLWGKKNANGSAGPK